MTLWQRGEWAFSLANMVGSVLAGCAAVVLGAALAQGIVQPTWAWLVGVGQSRVSESNVPRLAREQPADDSPATRLERLLESEADLGETGQ